jgi:hypothetical protein
MPMELADKKMVMVAVTAATQEPMLGLMVVAAAQVDTQVMVALAAREDLEQRVLAVAAVAVLLAAGRVVA